MTAALLIAYAAGYLWCYRFVVGTLMLDVEMPDALFVGALLNILWPLLVLGRLAQRWYYAHEQRFRSIFRPPSPIARRTP